MMNHKKDKTEEILNSLQQTKRAEPKPFLYTRVQAAIAAKNKEEQSIFSKLALLLQRPVFAFSLILLVLLVNAFCFFQSNLSSKYDTAIQPSTKVQEFAINVNSLYDLDNPDQ